MNCRLDVSFRRSLLFAAGLIFSSAMAVLPNAARANTQETLVFLRHGEKPDDAHETGQLTCQGMNRALALRQVLLTRYGTPDFIFAPTPASNQNDAGQEYYSMRPLTTIAPLAVAAGRAVLLDYKTKDIDSLQKELMKSAYASALVFVAWEHTYMDQLVANLVAQNGGDASQVPAWPDDDFDSLFVVQLDRSGSSTTVTFLIDHEGLDGQSTDCADPLAARADALHDRLAEPQLPPP